MDDLENAILIIFDESGTFHSELKHKAIQYCDKIKHQPAICTICIQKICFSGLFQVQFWCLQTLQDVVKARYSSMNADEKYLVRKSVFSIACIGAIDDKNVVRLIEGPAFIKNKLAQVIVTLICFEYPSIWSSVFVDFLSHMSGRAVVIDMFCRVLNALDDEVISVEYAKDVASRIKDAMREQCVPQIVRAWYDVVSMYRSSDEMLCATVLDALRRLVAWVDIGLVVNDAFTPLLFDLVLGDGLSEQLRGAAAGCLTAVVSKKMDSQSKLSLLKSLQIRRVFGLVRADSDSELISKVAALMTGYAGEAFECFRKLKAEDAKSISMELLNEVLPSVFFVMQHCELESTFNIVQFLLGYVNALKTLSPIREIQLHHLGQILEVIHTEIRYDPMYRDNLDRLDKIGKEEEDRMVEFRKDLFVLFRNVGGVAPDVCQIFIRNSLAASVASSSDCNVEEVEAALSLFYSFGESINGETMKPGSGPLGELVPMLLSTRLPCHSNRLVALVYLETITRYMKFVQENTQYVHMVLAAFLDERGIHHPNVNVSRRASYLFMKAVRLLKLKLVPFIENILQSLQDRVTGFTSINYSSLDLSASEDTIHIFEAIGVLIGMEDVAPEKQSAYLSSLLTPLCQQVDTLLMDAKALTPEEAPQRIANIQQIIVAINSLSKGFSERLVTSSRPGIGLMFKQLFDQTLDVLLQVLVVFPNIEPLRIKVTSFIHRMVETLGASVFPYLPKALEQLLVDSQPKELVGVLVLLNQLIGKFNRLFGDILDEVYPAIAGRILNIIPTDGFPSGPVSNTEENRELEEVQRMLYAFLHLITTHDLSSVFLSPRSRSYLQPIMQLLLFTSCKHKDKVVRKVCVQIFIKLIKDWCAVANDEEKVPGFQNFIIETFATNCCLYSLLDTSFEFRDTNTLVLFGEIVLAQKVMYEKLGNDFLVHFVTKGFPAAHCPQDLAEKYCQKLQGSDMKAFKSFYKSLIENVRLQQNGNLPVR